MSVSFIDGHIDEPKITDNEIIKALECCVSYEYTCLNCPYCEDKHYTEENGFELMPNGKYYDDLSCDEWLKRDVFDLVNRQKAEKETLKIELQAMRNAANGYKIEVEKLKKGINIELENYASEYDNKIKAEAVKNFAERLKDKAYYHEEYNTMVLEDVDEIIDNLYKETVGDADGKRKEEIP